MHTMTELLPGVAADGTAEAQVAAAYLSAFAAGRPLYRVERVPLGQGMQLAAAGIAEVLYSMDGGILVFPPPLGGDEDSAVLEGVLTIEQVCLLKHIGWIIKQEVVQRLDDMAA